MNYRPKVWVTGTGCISPSGKDPEEFWKNALNGKTSIKNGLGILSEEKPLGIALFALKQAMSQAGWNSLNPDDGLILATTTGYVSHWEKGIMDYFKGSKTQSYDNVLQQERLGLVLDDLSTHLNFKGKRLLLSTACTASTHAIGLAKLWLQTGKVKRCLVGGVEALSILTVEGFRSLQLLSSAAATPFDKNRTGINLTEASAFICLETESTNALASISGAGFSTDAFHMTTPHPEGKGTYLALKQALQEACLNTEDVSWIHAHGTGSIHNDAAEAAAIEVLFKECVPPVSSTKAIHGHSLAASGILETVLCIQAMKENTILKSWGCEEVDPKIKIQINQENRKTKIKHILKNTLGFGGTNGALVISAVSESMK